MLQMIERQGTEGAASDVQGMIHGGVATGTSTWDETMAMTITEVQGEPYGRYFQVVITDQAGSVDVDVLLKLERELGKNLEDCVVTRKRKHKEHPWYPGSTYFDLVTLYAG